MREEPLPQVLRPRRQAWGEQPGLDRPQTADAAAEFTPGIDIAQYSQPTPPFMLDAEEARQVHIAVVEFRRQARLRELARQRERLVLAAMVLPLMAMLFKLLWSILSGSRWWPDETHALHWQGFVGGDW